jgi:hypothetical protein
MYEKGPVEIQIPLGHALFTHNYAAVFECKPARLGKKPFSVIVAAIAELKFPSAE